MTGMMTESSPPSDMRGTKLVPATGRMSFWNPTFDPGNAALAGAVVVDRAAVEGGGEGGESLGALLELSPVERHVDAEVVEEGPGDRAGDGNAVLGVGGQVGVAADGGDAVHGDGHLDALVQLRVVGIARHAGCRPDWSTAPWPGWAHSRRALRREYRSRGFPLRRRRRSGCWAGPRRRRSPGYSRAGRASASTLWPVGLGLK